MTSTAAPPAVSRASVRTRGFRTDIQALRAVAIVLVVVNHLWPDRLPGGYVGVDVFFVISGFLITGHLLSEVDRTGRIRLAAFYARRIRRLLPAALLVIVVTLVGVWLLLPFTRWGDNALQSIASVFYVENWALAALSVDYSAHNAASSAVQHFWSLSVEEQFYLVWPLLILVTVSIAVAGRAPVRRAVLAVIAGVAVLSFVAAVAYTAASPAQAYFVTFTRAWQFAVGAAIAMLPAAVLGRLNAVTAASISALGFIGIAVAAVLFGSHTPYPGAAAALPVLATAAVLIAGTGRRAPVLLISTVTDSRPVQWLGDISYSLYLWHWPLIVLAPFVIDAPLSWWSRLSVLAVALVLAAATRRLVEIPAQRMLWWRSPRRAYAGAAAMMAVAGLVALLLLAASSWRSSDAAADEGRPTTCSGLGSAGGQDACDPTEPVADPVVTQDDAYFGLAPQCGDLLPLLEFDGRGTTRECDFSAGADAPRVWLVGDSHAEQWQAAIFPIAAEQGWRLTISSFPGCPPAEVAFVGFDALWGPVDFERCRQWASSLSDELVEEAPDLVITSMAARQQLVDDGSGRPHDEQFVEGLRETWQRWTDAGIAVVPVLDTPLNADVRDQDCLILNAGTPQDCAVPRDVAMPSDPVALAASGMKSGVWPADMSRFLCDDSLCFAAVEGEPVYFDADHLSSAFAASLSRQFQDVVDDALASGAQRSP